MQKKEIESFETCYYSSYHIIIILYKAYFNEKYHFYSTRSGDLISMIGVMNEWSLDKVNDWVACRRS